MIHKTNQEVAALEEPVSAGLEHLRVKDLGWNVLTVYLNIWVWPPFYIK